MTETTPSLAEFREMEAHDPNAFWRLDCGHHQNLLDEATDALDEANRKLAAVEMLRLNYRVRADFWPEPKAQWFDIECDVRAALAGQEARHE